MTSSNDFNGVVLQYSDTVLHLGHLLSFNLDDKDDIVRVTKDVIRKANSVLYTFRYLDPFVTTFLFLTLRLHSVVPVVSLLQVAISHTYLVLPESLIPILQIFNAWCR